MARTIVYSQRTKGTSEDESSLFHPSHTRNIDVAGGNVDAAGGVDEQKPADKYIDKLAKYIPAEALAFFGPIAAISSQEQSLLFAAAGLSIVLIPIYLFVSAKRFNPKQMPRWYSYFLACLAFAIWAQATSDIGGLIGLTKIWSSALLSAGVFAIPGIDEFLTFVTGEKKSE